MVVDIEQELLTIAYERGGSSVKTAIMSALTTRAQVRGGDIVMRFDCGVADEALLGLDRLQEHGIVEETENT